MAPKAVPKKAAAPLTGVAKMKAELAKKKEAEEKARQEEEEAERRFAEERRLAEEQRRYEEEQRELEKLRKEREAKEAKKNGKAPINKKVLERYGSNVLVPDIERIRQEQEAERAAAAERAKLPKAPKPEKPAEKPVAAAEEEDERDEWEIEADELAGAEQAKAEAAAAEKAQLAKCVRPKGPMSTAAGDLRSPIVSVLGHVDTGKTSLLDKIRQTNVQGGEAGGITQQIGATFFPKESLVDATADLNKKLNYNLNVPGLLVIDTPGHESFTNLRSRGASLCDIAVLVVDIMHGLEQQTRESIKLLGMQKCPFIIALNKVDRLYGWKSTPNNDFKASLDQQTPDVRAEFKQRFENIQTEFYNETKRMCYPYYENDDFRRNVCVVPTSAVTGEGISDLLLLMIELVQRFRNDQVTFKDEIQCTVLEVKPIEGLGHTIDVILVNGQLYEGDDIVLSGINGPFKTQIRSLLTPQPLRELRVKSDYIHHKMVRAALGLKIAANDLDQCVPGTTLRVILEGDTFESLAKEAQKEVSSVQGLIDATKPGVVVQSSTLGSLEALLTFLRDMKIPVCAANLGPVHKRHMHTVLATKARNPRFASLLAFDVPITPEAQQMARENDINVFEARIIYHLFDAFKKHEEEWAKEEKERLIKEAVFPVVLKISECFRNTDPIILGVHVLRGNLLLGTPLGVMKDGRMFTVGKVIGIERDNKPEAFGKRSNDYAIKVSNPHDASISYGRHFDDSFELLSVLTRPAVEAVKDIQGIFKEEKARIAEEMELHPERHRDRKNGQDSKDAARDAMLELDQDTINLLRDLVKTQGIPPANKFVQVKK